jgi:hypothetical protein
MANVEIVKVDQGGANARILAREAKVDFRRVEAASLKIATRFSSAEGKRMFVRMFNTLQLNMHFISVIARTRLDHDDIGKIETAMRGRIDGRHRQPERGHRRRRGAVQGPRHHQRWRPTTRCRWTSRSTCCRRSAGDSWRCWASSTS